LQALQVFDSNAGDLAPHHFFEFAYPYLERIATSVRAKLAADNVPAVPLILFAKGANHALSHLAQHAGYDVLGLDWLIDPRVARALVDPTSTSQTDSQANRPRTIALQGNMDPNVLYGGHAAIEREVRRMCEAFRGAEGSSGRTRAWIGNLGHGITPGVDPEDLRFFLECMQKYSRNE
jgi:uroporphyrinogen decarboxylase